MKTNGEKLLLIMVFDGVSTTAPIRSGSMFFNYKETFSIVLLAIVDAQLRFIYVDVGTNGRVADKGVWNKSAMKKCLDENRLKLPPACPLPGFAEDFPFVIVGDEGFALSSKVTIPYPKDQIRGRRDRRIFNYRYCIEVFLKISQMSISLANFF